MRGQVVEGGYRLVEPPADLPADAPSVVLAACGAVVPEAYHAARMLADEGVRATVLDLVSPDRLYRAWRHELDTAAAAARRPDLERLAIARLLPPSERRTPIVTVHDAASHALAWLGSVFGQRVHPVGVDAFGQSGSIAELYDLFHLLPGQLVNAALTVVEAPA